MQADKAIRVGLVGVGNWAEYGHIPALKLLPQFEITAVCSRSAERAQLVADRFNIRFALSDENELASHPEVDLVVVLPPAPAHAQIAKLAIAAGKDVYCEWPLTTSTTNSAQLLELARAAGVRHLVGLQRTISPSSLFLGDLLGRGFVGELRSVRMHVSMSYFGAVRSNALAWTVPAENFSHVLSIYGGHFMDMLFRAVGMPRTVSAISAIQFPHLEIEGKSFANETSDEIVMIGELANDAIYQIQIEGGKTNQSGLQIDITGTLGDLKVSNAKSFGTTYADVIEGATAGGTWSTLAVPAQYQQIPSSTLDFSVQDLAHLYLSFARGVHHERGRAPDFSDALRMHSIIDAIEKSSASRSEESIATQ